MTDPKLLLILVILVIIGGLNWLVTGFRIHSSTEKTKVPDLIDLLGLTEYSVYVYLVVGVASVLVLLQHRNIFDKDLIKHLPK